MKQAWRKIFHRPKGSEIIELAFLLPLLLGLTFGTCEFGYYFFLQHNLQGAAREGARAGIPFEGTRALAEGKINAFLSSAGLVPGNFHITFNKNPEDAVPQVDDIIVTVTGTWGSPGVGIKLLGFISNGKVVVGRAVMRKEG